MRGSYTTPLREIRFVLEHVVGSDGLAAGIVTRAAKRLGSNKAATVSRAAGGALRPIDGGRPGSPHLECGDASFPACAQAAVDEMLVSTSPSLALLSGASRHAVRLLLDHSTDEQNEPYLRKLLHGEWSATLCTAEPHAGAEACRPATRAERQPDGSYRISGKKIFSSLEDEDLAEDLVHLVLARTTDAQQGPSLFLVPEHLLTEDGVRGERNGVCLESEPRGHAGRTGIVTFGNAGRGAVARRVGEEGQGVREVLAMARMAQIATGLSRVAIAERAYQHALAHAKDRCRRRAPGEPERFVLQPEVRRTLAAMRCGVQAARALAYVTAHLLDRGQHDPEPQRRITAQRRAELLTPVVNGWCTEVGDEVVSMAMRIFAGMADGKEPGASLPSPDRRSRTSCAGFVGQQALDLVGRRLLLDGGVRIRELIQEMARDTASLPRADVTAIGIATDLTSIRQQLEPAVDVLEDATLCVLESVLRDSDHVAVAARPYLRMLGAVVGAHLLARSAVCAGRLLTGATPPAAERTFLRAKITTARLFAERILPPAVALHAPDGAGEAASLEVVDEDRGA